MKKSSAFGLIDIKAWRVHGNHPVSLRGSFHMHPETVRVVYDDRPYLVIRSEDGSLARAYGPFTPGTEPHLAECDDSNAVREASVLSALEELLPISPSLPRSRGTLAAG